MKIIKVNGCHECPFVDFDDAGMASGYPQGCQKDREIQDVREHYESKTYPDNCPLENLFVPRPSSRIKPIRPARDWRFYE